MVRTAGQSWGRMGMTSMPSIVCVACQRERSETGGVSDVPDVLFVCVHNAGRSQMAAALLAHRAVGRVRVRSAGSEPADQLNPAVVEAMREAGLDITAESP